MTLLRHYWTLRLLFVGSLILTAPAVSSATVFGWTEEEGVRHFTNDPEAVPEAHRPSVQQFTSKLAAKPSTTDMPSPSPVLPGLPAYNAYERGLEHGLELAERQVALASEMARSILQAAPPVPPPPMIIIQQQPAPIIRYVDREPGWSPYYGFLAPYTSLYWGGYYPSSYPYGFRSGRLIPHSHFFPGTRGGHRGLFFPYGHFSHQGFLFGHGFVSR
ncbi:MAG: DUF4124 domain-containing protein [Candidatus Binatia bacterium]